MINTTATVDDDGTLRNSAFSEKNGRYVLGGDVSVSVSALGWWEKKEVLPDPSDLVYVLEEKYVGRPDLLAYAFYGETQLWWLILQFNNILDPELELVQGKVLLIPSLEKISSTYRTGTNVGGI